MSSELEQAAEALRHYAGFWQRFPISDREAAAMARELRAYGALTEEVRATLSHSNQPANFAMVLKTEGPSHR
jgi:hypothetical protein